MTKLKGMTLLFLVATQLGYAAVLPDRTRVIFNAADKASSVKISNQSTVNPYLAYSWIENEKGVKSDDVFTALPPLQRVEPASSTQVRLVKQAGVDSLPKDRESLFYYNLREVPPKADASDNHAVLQVAPQSRLKLFWRPTTLRKKVGARTELEMRISQSGQILTVNNPTPYYITIAYLGKDSTRVLPGFATTMIAPFSTAPLSTGNYKGQHFYLGYMDDYGALRMTDLQCQGRCTLTVPEDKR